MSDHNGPVEPDRVPYIPAWTDTPSQGFPRATPPQSALPLPAANDGGRAARRAAQNGSGRSGKGPLVAVVALVVVLLGVGGWLLTRTGDEGSGFKEGSCLSDLAGDMPHTVDCSSADARYLVIEWFQDTSDTGLCASVSGGNIPVQTRVDGGHGILCVGKRG